MNGRVAKRSLSPSLAYVPWYESVEFTPGYFSFETPHPLVVFEGSDENDLPRPTWRRRRGVCPVPFYFGRAETIHRAKASARRASASAQDLDSQGPAQDRS